MGYGLYILIGAVVGGGCVWLVYDLKAKRIIDDLRKRLGIAEAENLRIGPLERQMAETKAQNAALQGRIAELADDIAQKADTIAALNVQLVEQVKAARNKLSMLNELQGRFCQALSGLSETALNCDNDEFIRVMEDNVTSFEKTLLEDFAKWQSRDKAVTREVCDLADSEQAQRPLFVQDQAIEGLVAVDAAAPPAESCAEASGASEEMPDVEDEPAAAIDDDAHDVEGDAAAAEVADELRLFDEEAVGEVNEAEVRVVAEAAAAVAEEVRPVDEEAVAVVEAAAEAAADLGVSEDAEGGRSDEDEDAVGVEEPQEPEADIDAALIEDGTADAVADLERALEEELALELDGAEDDADLMLDVDKEDRGEAAAGSQDEEDRGEIRPADEGLQAEGGGERGATDDEESGPTLSLKFPIRELPALDEEDGGEAVAEEAPEDPRKKKRNSESGPSEVRKEAV